MRIWKHEQIIRAPYNSTVRICMRQTRFHMTVQTCRQYRTTSYPQDSAVSGIKCTPPIRDYLDISMTHACILLPRSIRNPQPPAQLLQHMAGSLTANQNAAMRLEPVVSLKFRRLSHFPAICVVPFGLYSGNIQYLITIHIV